MPIDAPHATIHTGRWAALLTVAVLVTGLFAAAPAAHAGPPPAGARLNEVTGPGLHNSYEKVVVPALADAATKVTSAGAPGLLELDVWANATLRHWYVGHNSLFANDNNCTRDVRIGPASIRLRDQDLGVCLDNLRVWHDQHPGHPPVLLKMEMKNGFDGRNGFGAEAFDALFRARLVDAALFRPADLLAGRFATPDAAATGGGWPTLTAARGKFVVLVMNGTFELGNPLDTFHTDVEYATRMRSAPGAAAGFALAQRSGATGDPRTAYPDVALRPWFVAFDTDAVGFAALPPATRSWYSPYLVIADDVQQVPPVLDRSNPDPAAAAARVRLLACDNASIASADWVAVAGWYAPVARGTC